jgi:hypothetical protein
VRKIQKLVKKLSSLVTRRIIRDRRDITDDIITCGLHSGIPECCVLFFVNEWQKWWDTKNFKNIRRHNKNTLCSWVRYNANNPSSIVDKGHIQCYITGPQYIPCTKCQRDGIKHIKLKRCSCAS